MRSTTARRILGTLALFVIALSLSLPALAQEAPAGTEPRAAAPAAGEESAPAEPALHAPEAAPGHEAGAPADHGEAAAHGEEHGEGHGGGHDLGAALPLWSVIPFAGILLSIAVFPLVAPHFWHHHYPKVAAFWAIVFAVPFLLVYKGAAFHEILHIYLIDYIPFIILLWGLFTVAGGIVVRGSIRGTPLINTIMLAIGTAMASWVGTTGAAMVMIRPVLRANAHRKNKTHIVVFFIFLVANIGGSLTPLGDPPLFLGFLHGVPFFWTFTLIKPLLVVGGALLVIFFLLDTFMAKRDHAIPHEENPVKFSLAGWHNFFFLGGIVAAVLVSGIWRPGAIHVLGIPVEIQNIVRDVIIILMGLLSLKTTKLDLRRENDFSWGPILEVGYLFAGIFMTIIPAIAILRAGEHGALAGLIRSVEKPWHYFWATGSLSSFLDNAPTYLTFFNTALGKFYPGLPEAQAVHELIATHAHYLMAISAGAVFMGANTYIGNAPNFMVKSIAEEAGVKMPSFFGYIVRWSLPILVPLFVVATLIFFRH